MVEKTSKKQEKKPQDATGDEEEKEGKLHVDPVTGEKLSKK